MSRNRVILALLCAISALSFANYASTFIKHGTSLGSRSDVVLDADTGPFTLLLTQWQLGRVYGDASNHVDRSVGDQAEEHKIKHVLLPLAFSPLVDGIELVGVSPFVAAKLVGAFSGALVVFLCGFLLMRNGADPQTVLFSAITVGVAPGLWLYSSLPESWTFSGALLLCALSVQLLWPARAGTLGVFVGIAMLNNLLFGLLAVLPFLRKIRLSGELRAATGGAVKCGLFALATWAVALTLLSLSDPALRPDRVLAFHAHFTFDVLPPPERFGALVMAKEAARGVWLVWLGPITLRSALTPPYFGFAAVLLLSIAGVLGALNLVRRRKAVEQTDTENSQRALVEIGGIHLVLLGVLVLRFPGYIPFYSPVLLPTMALVTGLLSVHCGHHLRRSLWLVPFLLALTSVAEVRRLESALINTNGDLSVLEPGVPRLSWRVLKSSASPRGGARASETEGRSRSTEVRVHQSASERGPD